MKKLKSLDEFESVPDKPAKPVVESEPLLTEAQSVPVKTKYRFEISSNLKKVAKIQKTLIDLSQLLTEISDEIIALKLNYPNIDPKDVVTLNNMKYNIDNMVFHLTKEKKHGKFNGLIDNSKRLQRNLERLREGFLTKKGAK